MMWVHVLLFLGLKEVFFNDYNFFCMPVYTLPLPGYSGTHQRHKEHQWRQQCKRQNKGGNSLIMLCYCFLLPINQCGRAVHIQNNAPSHGEPIFLTNIHKRVSFWKHVVVLNEFLRLLASLIEKEGENCGSAACDRQIPHPSININISFIHSSSFTYLF